MADRYVVGFSGSLRVKSNTKALLRYAASVSATQIRIVDLLDIPFYNQDVEDNGFPESVQALRELVRGSVGLFFSLTEYNGQISGVLKNTIDWLSRPTHSPSPLTGKKAALITGGGGYAGSRAEENLIQLAKNVGLEILDSQNKVQVKFYAPPQKFSPEAELIDEETKQAIQVYVNDFNKFIQ